MSDDEAERLRALAGLMRARNGRLEVDWISRREKPRWRMLRLDGQWYDRERLRALLARRRPLPEIVPVSRRRLTAAELDAVRDTAPWRLADRVRVPSS